MSQGIPREFLAIDRKARALRLLLTFLPVLPRNASMISMMWSSR